MLNRRTDGHCVFLEPQSQPETNGRCNVAIEILYIGNGWDWDWGEMFLSDWDWVGTV